MSNSSSSNSITEVKSKEASSLSANAKALLNHGPPPFRWSSLIEKPVVNHLNGKSYTLPIFNLTNQYGINFHLSWLGFFVAFLSWFAFSPLIPEAIKDDLKLTSAQIGNSNVIALLATLVVRLGLGPLVDRYGPRKCMAFILILGAIPSGLAGTITSVGGLYTIRFFIGILGGTFVPCQAWTTAFFDKSIIGTANALAGGWGNAGGGVTFVIQVSVFARLVADGMSSHNAWRAAFAIVPVPLLLSVAALTLAFGTDCPAGKWENRHNLPASAIAAKNGHFLKLDESEKRVVESKMREKEQGRVQVQEAQEDEEDEAKATTDLDIAVAEVLTWRTALRVITVPYTWLPALMYMSTFGFELAVDANLASVLYQVHRSADFGQTKAGYYASVFGFLNIVTRPVGGYLGDLIYRSYGTRGKKYLTIALGICQGALAVALGFWSEKTINSGGIPSLGIQMALVVLMAIFCEAANGSNFSLVPHCSSFNNGFMTGIVGAMGNVGGIIYALIFRYHSGNGYATAWWISGVFAMAVNILCCFIEAPPN